MENIRKFVTWPVAGIVLLILLVVGILLGYRVFLRDQAPAVVPTATVDPVSAAAGEESAEPTTAASAMPEPPTPSSESSAMTPAEDPGESMTVLVLGIGTHSEQDEADAIYVVHLDAVSGGAEVTTFATSLEKEAEGVENRMEWIWREAYYAPSGDDITAATALAEVLDLDFGIVVDHYVVMREDSLASMIDTVGGLDVDVPAACCDYITAGAQHFDGETAWKYVTWLEDETVLPTIPMDLERIERHKLVLVALQEKLTTPATLLKVPALMAQFLTDEVVVTDFSADEVLDLLGSIKTLSEDRITVTVVPISD